MDNRVWCIMGVVLVVGLTGCNSASLKGPAETDGWVSLFDGRTLAGWHVACVDRDKVKTFWTVDQGTILANSLGDADHDYVWLLSDQEYGDFLLRLQFQVYPSAHGNSGVQIRSRYDTAAQWLNGPQVDVCPDPAWRTGMMWDETRGNQRWIWPDLMQGWVKPEMAHPGHRVLFAEDVNGPWNNLEIEAKGTRLRVALNGLCVADYDGIGVLNDAVHQARRVGMRGHLALQIHIKDEVLIRYRDLRIRRL